MVTNKFKRGDRVKILTRKSSNTVIPLEECSLIEEYNLLKIKPEFCYITHVWGDSYSVGLSLDNHLSEFSEEDLEFYDELENVRNEIYTLLELDK